MKRSTRLTRTAAAAATAAILAGSLTGCAGTTESAPTAAVDRKEADALVHFAEWLGKEIAGAGVAETTRYLFGMVSGEEAENPDKERFEELNSKLEEFSENLTRTQESIDVLTEKVQAGNYKNLLVALKSSRDSVDYLYNDANAGFMPIANASAKLADDLAAGASDATVRADRDRVAAATERFQTAYATGERTYGPLARKIHGYLVPGTLSVLRAKGQLLLGQRSFIVRADTEELRAEYERWADYEATAAIMASFYAGLVSGDPASDMAQSPLKTWASYQRAELAALPPVLPEGQSIVTKDGVKGGRLVGGTHWAWGTNLGLYTVTTVPLPDGVERGSQGHYNLVKDALSSWAFEHVRTGRWHLADPKDSVDQEDPSDTTLRGPEATGFLAPNNAQFSTIQELGAANFRTAGAYGDHPEFWSAAADALVTYPVCDPIPYDPNYPCDPGYLLAGAGNPFANDGDYYKSLRILDGGPYRMLAKPNDIDYLAQGSVA